MYDDGIVRIHRKCMTCLLGRAYYPHCWEWLNPATDRPFRRGRVVFMCSMRVARRPPRLVTAGPEAVVRLSLGRARLKVPAAHPIP